MYRNINSQRRTAESPMDFEWQSSGGPTDPNSPFPQYKPGQGPKNSFASPVKSSFVAASTTTATPFRNPSFTTPRKPFEADLFSEVSGAESSPADNADVEDTPDYPRSIKAMTAFPNTPGAIKQPIFGRYGSEFKGSSPGRADVRKGKFGNAIVQKARRRRRMDKDLVRRNSQDDSEDESDDSRKSRPKSREKKSSRTGQNLSWFASFFNYIDAHPNLPNILSYWAQMSINFFIAVLTIFGIATFWSTIRSDVDKASENARSLVLAEMERCAVDFARNGCGVRPPPALEAVCREWEHCMTQNPDNVGRARVSAHTFAEIFNSFIEPISYKAMIFIFLGVFMAIVVNNLAFSSFRTKTTPPPPHNPFFPQNQNQNFQWGNPPQTPSHRDMTYDAMMGGESYRAIMPSGTPGRALNRSPSKSGMRSPSNDW